MFNIDVLFLSEICHLAIARFYCCRDSDSFSFSMGWCHDIKRDIRVFIFVEKEQRCFVTLEIIFQDYSQEDTLFGKESEFFFSFEQEIYSKIVNAKCVLC